MKFISINSSRKIKLAGLAMAFAASSAVTSAMTLTVDSSNVDTYSKLSLAVAAVYQFDDGPDIINLAVDSLPDADLQVVLDKPITINGDAENSGVGNGIKCDLLVDMPGIIAQAAPTIDAGKSYLHIGAVGTVSINNIRIRPNGDGVYTNVVANLVSGIRMLKPGFGTSDYILTNVFVSGSDSSNNYVPLDTGTDLYGAGYRMWGGNSSSNEGTMAMYGVFQLTDSVVYAAPTGGTYNTTLDHCHGGLGKAAAINMLARTGTHQVLGGIYGHCARDGIRVAGSNVTLKGTVNDRLRVVRTTNVTGSNAHCIEVVSPATVSLIEYVDIVGVNSANNLALRSGTISLVNFVRAFGKFGGGSNQTGYVDAATVTKIQNSTFVGGGSQPSPFNVTSAALNSTVVENCIFTALVNTGTINTNNATYAFNNCAIPTDGYTNETLAAIPTTGANATYTPPIVTASPRYMKVLADYDWSDAQNGGNGPGNANVLRPSNSTDYVAAGTDGTPLVGGAGGTEVPVTLSGFALE